MADDAHAQASGPPPFALSNGVWLCTVQGYPVATWLSDVDAGGPRDPVSGTSSNGVVCKQISELDALLIGRKVWNILRIISRYPIPE